MYAEPAIQHTLGLTRACSVARLRHPLLMPPPAILRTCTHHPRSAATQHSFRAASADFLLSSMEQAKAPGLHCPVLLAAVGDSAGSVTHALDLYSPKCYLIRFPYRFSSIQFIFPHIFPHIFPQIRPAEVSSAHLC